MKPSSASATSDIPSNVVRLKAPTASRARRSDAEFLPAALEIIETPASPVGRAIAGTIVAFLAIAICWSCIGEVDIIATAQGRIIPTGKSKVIQPFDTGVVRAISVVDGSFVRRGDVLVELDPTSDKSDESRSRFDLTEDQLDIARLQALLGGGVGTSVSPAAADPRMIGMAHRQMEAQAAEQAAKLDALGRQIAQKQAEGREVDAQIEKIEADLPLITEQRDIRQSLLQNQYGSRLTYLQVQQQLVESQHELESQKQKAEETVQALAALDRQKAETVAEYRKGLLTDLAKAEISANEHAEDIRKAELKRDLRTLRAPVDGTVQQLSVHTLGGVVTPAEQLMVIVPKGTGIEIEADLPNKDVGFVQIGQPVEIKVEAFTFTRYGLLHGTVLSLSQDAVAAGGNEDTKRPYKGVDENDASDEQARQSAQPAYVAHVALETTAIQTENGFVPLEPGMAVTTEIKTGRRTVISYLLSPLSRFREDGLRER